MASIWRPYDKIIKELLLKHQNDNPKPPYTFYAKIILGTRDGSTIDNRVGELARYIGRNEKAILDMHEGIPLATSEIDIPLSSAKNLWIKTKAEKGKPGVSAFIVNPDFEDPNAQDIDLCYDEIKEILIREYENIVKFETQIVDGSEVGVVVVADLHLGAYIDGLVRTKNYSIPILIEYLENIVAKTNRMNYKEVHVFFLGDMIESFTGLNHKNSWKGLQKGMIGAEVIKFSVNILHEKLLSKINNLQSVKLVAGNHDRLTSDKDEDTDGGACDLIAFGLDLRGYNVEFHPTVISREIDGINYILLHGHKGLSKKPTKDLCWDFGKKGVYNVILEGHLHSIIQKLSVNMKGKFNIIKDDSVDHIRMNARSLFTGNGYSEDLGYTSNAGFSIITNNGKGLPNINNILL